MSSLFEWLVSLGPGPWAFGLAALASVAFTVVTLSRMYCKYRSREVERLAEERFERLRMEREREYRRFLEEAWRSRDELLRYLNPREIARWARENADDEGDEEQDAASGDD